MKHTKAHGTTEVETAEQYKNILFEKNGEEKRDNNVSRQNDERCEKNIRLETDTVRLQSLCFYLQVNFYCNYIGMFKNMIFSGDDDKRK